ncbi:MAG: RNA polymerase sigma factor [Pseudomonadota bacterium]
MTDQVAESFIQEREQLISIACKIVKDHGVAEDLVQESWLRWHFHKYSAANSRSIFRKIVANLARDYFRRRKREGELLAYADWQSTNSPDSERIYSARQELVVAMNALSELPQRTVLAYRMHCMDGLSCAEIGRRLKLSRSRAHALVEEAIVHVTMRLMQR